MTESTSERDDEPLPEDAEIDPPAEGDLDESDEVLTPFPGFGDHNPIFGGGGVGAFEGTPAKDVLSGRLPGDVLLEARGRRTDVGGLVGVIVGATLFGLAIAVWPDRIGANPTGVAFVLILGALVVLGAWFLRDLVFTTDVEVTLTSEGVARHGKGADAWVPWSEVRGYVEGATLVTLQCPGGTVPVPTLDAETHAKLMALLHERDVPRL